MKRKIISLPPNYFYAFIIFIVAVYFLFPYLNIIIFPYNLIGLVIFTLGFYLMSWSWLRFKKHQTPESFKKSTALVQDGPYKFSRNPMYLGMTLILLGLAVLFKNIIGLIAPFLFFLTMHFMFIPFEEEKNEKELGEKYIDYKKKARRWI